MSLFNELESAIEVSRTLRKAEKERLIINFENGISCNEIYWPFDK